MHLPKGRSASNKETTSLAAKGRTGRKSKVEEEEEEEEEQAEEEEDFQPEESEAAEEQRSSRRPGAGRGGNGSGRATGRVQGSFGKKPVPSKTRTKSKAGGEQRPAQASKKQKVGSQKVGWPEETPRASAPAPPVVPQGTVVPQMTPQEKADLQAKIDELSDAQLDRVIDFLTPDLPQGQECDDVSLDLDNLSAERQQALLKIVDEELSNARSSNPEAPAPTAPAGAPAGPSAPGTAASGQGMMSPSFPVMEPGATPRSAPATPRSEAAPPGEGSARDAKRQHAWEVCVAREVQKQAHLRDIREAASASGSTPGATPQGGDPTAGEPPAGMPDLTLPPAGMPEASAASAPAATAAAEQEANPPQENAAENAPAAIGGSSDSMLDATQDVLALVNDFSSWM